MKRAVVDIETDALDATKIHCIVADPLTEPLKIWVGDECKNFAAWSKGIDEFIMHNGISFDMPILNKFTGSDIKLNQIRDTMIESQLFNPVRDGGHSLGAWGNHLGFKKGDMNDFKEYSSEMLAYCKQDTELTRRVANTLKEEGKNFSDKSYELERKIRWVINEQEKNGFAFDIKNAILLLAQLTDEQDKLEEEAQKLFEPVKIELKTKTKYIPFNIASRKQIAERLMEKGWEPKQKTEKGNIVINEAVLSQIKKPDEVKPLAEMFNRYFLLQKRTGLLKSWIKECRNSDRVHGRVLTLRTITGRMAHATPNMAQVPSVSSPYGKECRGLWTVNDPSEYRLVGTDASGLELRCLAHYMNDPEYTNVVLTGDIHTAHQQAAGLKTRDQAKTFIYAFLYGAGPAKIGKIVGKGPEAGQALIKKFLNRIPALKRLRENVAIWSKDGTLPALDGRLLHIRSEHAALNTLLQGAGAIICKQWLIHMMERVYKNNMDVKLVASIHDEYQFEVALSDIERFCKITKEAMRQTQKTLKVRCELDSDYKVGKTWEETH
jgi:DNA polymerase-1